MLNMKRNIQDETIPVWVELKNGQYEKATVSNDMFTFESLVFNRDNVTVDIHLADGTIKSMCVKDLMLCDPSFGCEDNGSLRFLNIANLLENICFRFTKAIENIENINQIYTYTGRLLIAMNPYCSTDSLYDENVLRLYWNSSLSSLPPHPFAIARITYSSLYRDSKPQSIIISGESGSGKTECSKHILKYLSFVSNQQYQEDNLGVESRILHANFILESFGNAKTIRNDNSSRFGKLVMLHFGSSGSIIYATIKTYLLAKSRVSNCPRNERNYHIFYSLCNNTNSIEKKKWRLYPQESYSYLGTCQMEKNINFDDIYHAMKVIGIKNEDTLNSIFSTLSAILLLGNIIVKKSEDELSLELSSTNWIVSRDDSELDSIYNDAKANLLDDIFYLFGLESLEFKKEFIDAATTKKIYDVCRVLSVVEVKQAIDSLARYLYQAIFDFILFAININMFSESKCKRTMSPDEFYSKINNQSSISNMYDYDSIMRDSLAFDKISYHNYIGILDIFGFENLTPFAYNGFEQLCINYANEVLHTIFLREFLLEEKSLYEYEGVPFPDFTIPSNDQTCEAINGSKQNLGIFQILDETSCIPVVGEKDEFLCQKINQTLGKNSHDNRLGGIIQPKFPTRFEFIVRHYPGDVTYSTIGFNTLNFDSASSNLKLILMKSGSSFISKLIKGQWVDLVQTNTSHTDSYGSSNYVLPKDNFDDEKLTEVNLSSPLNKGNHLCHLDKNVYNLLNPSDDLTNHSNTLKYTGESKSSQKSHSIVFSNQKSIKTLASLFKYQVEYLVSNLNETSSHFIRCIKPNDDKIPNSVDKIRIRHQLESSGMVEALKLMGQGFPCRISFSEIWTKYQYYLPSKFQSLLTPKEFTELLFRITGIKKKNYYIGNTKGFTRIGAFQNLESKLSLTDTNHMIETVNEIFHLLIKSKFKRCVLTVNVAAICWKSILRKRLLQVCMERQQVNDLRFGERHPTAYLLHHYWDALKISSIEKFLQLNTYRHVLSSLLYFHSLMVTNRLFWELNIAARTRIDSFRFHHSIYVHQIQMCSLSYLYSSQMKYIRQCIMTIQVLIFFFVSLLRFKARFRSYLRQKMFSMLAKFLLSGCHKDMDNKKLVLMYDVILNLFETCYIIFKEKNYLSEESSTQHKKYLSDYEKNSFNFVFILIKLMIFQVKNISESSLVSHLTRFCSTVSLKNLRCLLSYSNLRIIIDHIDSVSLVALQSIVNQSYFTYMKEIPKFKYEWNYNSIVINSKNKINDDCCPSFEQKFYSNESHASEIYLNDDNNFETSQIIHSAQPPEDYDLAVINNVSCRLSSNYCSNESLNLSYRKEMLSSTSSSDQFSTSNNDENITETDDVVVNEIEELSYLNTFSNTFNRISITPVMLQDSNIEKPNNISLSQDLQTNEFPDLYVDELDQQERTISHDNVYKIRKIDKYDYVLKSKNTFPCETNLPFLDPSNYTVDSITMRETNTENVDSKMHFSSEQYNNSSNRLNTTNDEINSACNHFSYSKKCHQTSTSDQPRCSLLPTLLSPPFFSFIDEPVLLSDSSHELYAGTSSNRQSKLTDNNISNISVTNTSDSMNSRIITSPIGSIKTIGTVSNVVNIKNDEYVYGEQIINRSEKTEEITYDICSMSDNCIPGISDTINQIELSYLETPVSKKKINIIQNTYSSNPEQKKTEFDDVLCSISKKDMCHTAVKLNSSLNSLISNDLANYSNEKMNYCSFLSNIDGSSNNLKLNNTDYLLSPSRRLSWLTDIKTDPCRIPSEFNSPTLTPILKTAKSKICSPPKNNLFNSSECDNELDQNCNQLSNSIIMPCPPEPFEDTQHKKKIQKNISRQEVYIEPTKTIIPRHIKTKNSYKNYATNFGNKIEDHNVKPLRNNDKNNIKTHPLVNTVKFSNNLNKHKLDRNVANIGNKVSTKRLQTNSTKESQQCHHSKHQRCSQFENSRVNIVKKDKKLHNTNLIKVHNTVVLNYPVVHPIKKEETTVSCNLFSTTNFKTDSSNNNNLIVNRNSISKNSKSCSRFNYKLSK